MLPGFTAHHTQLCLILFAEEVDFLPVFGTGILHLRTLRGCQLKAFDVLYYVGQLPVGPEAPRAERLFAERAAKGLQFWAWDLTVASETATTEVVAAVNGDWLP